MRVAVLSRDNMLREGIMTLLAHQNMFRVVGGMDDPANLATSASEMTADIIVIDTSALGSKDWSAVKAIRAEGYKIVALTAKQATKAEEEGSDAVVERSGGSAALFQGLRRASGDRALIVRESTPYYGSYPRMLTPREHEVATMVAQGMPNRRIAQTLGLREQSIKNLVSTVMRKLDCENRVQVALKLSTRG